MAIRMVVVVATAVVSVVMVVHMVMVAILTAYGREIITMEQNKMVIGKRQ